MEYKFKYGDWVKITTGFYEGCTGVAVETRGGNNTYYKVEIEKYVTNYPAFNYTSKILSEKLWIDSKNLEKIVF
jgi:hypothetical protein